MRDVSCYGGREEHTKRHWKLTNTISRIKTSWMSTYNFCICTFWWAFHLWCLRGRLCSRTKLCFSGENTSNDKSWIFVSIKLKMISYRLTSSADWAIKKPCVLEDIFAPRGLMDILESRPSSDLSSMASSNSLSLVKQSLTSQHLSKNKTIRN